MRTSWICGLLIAGCLVQASGTKANTVQAAVRLMSVKDDIAEFEIRLTNTSGRPIFVEESHKGFRNLHVVTIELQSEPGNWTYVGPKIDAGASSVFELRPGQSVSDRISISVSILGKEYRDLLRSPQPKYRARLRYFPSQEAWVTFGRSIGRKSRPVVVFAYTPD